MKKVITYGTFDLLTPGHIEQLRESKKLGDYLIVGLSTDEFNAIKNKKSYLSYEERKEIIEAIKYVDEVIPENDWNQKVDDIKKYNISILTMGEDWKGSNRFEYLKEYCDVVFIPRSGRYSSTDFRSFVNKHKNDDKFISKLKNKIKSILLYLFKWHLNFIYFFIKLFTTQKKQVFLLSRQTDYISVSFEMIINQLNKDKIATKVMCRKINNGLKNKLVYYFSLYKQMYYLATSKVVIIDGYNPTVSILKHKNLTVIQLWHALGAIKKFGYQTLNLDSGRDRQMAKIMNMHKNYDYVISGSKAMVDYFSQAFNIDEKKVLTFGTPCIDYMLTKVANREDKFKQCGFDIKKPLIVYAPTFRDNRPNDILPLINAIDLNKYNLCISIHPRAIEKIEKKEGAFWNPNLEFLDLIKICDYFVTDYSAAMIEAAIANKKLLLDVYDYHLYDKENGLNINLFEELPNYTSKEIDDIVKVIDSGKYDMKILENFKKKYVTNLKGNATKQICKLVEEKVNE